MMFLEVGFFTLLPDAMLAPSLLAELESSLVEVCGTDRCSAGQD
jgi:hypothetical protein